MLDPHFARARQRRLLDALADRKLDAVVIGLPEHVYYFSAHKPHWLQQAALVVTRDGEAWLTTANKVDETAAADVRACYEAQWNATQRQEQPAVVADQVVERLTTMKASSVGIDTSAVSAQVVRTLEGAADPIDNVVWQLRRRKDPDELALMRMAIEATRAMYARAREIVAPGVQEVRVYTELHAAAVETIGEPLSAYLGNDYACGGGGGPPRNGRAAKAGEIYILDLGPAYRGYFADNCRAFAVDRNPTVPQLEAIHAIAGVFPVVESMARPGARCREIFEAASAHLEQSFGKPLKHHLGHGVGLQPHEFPHLNPKWDDELLEGEVFTAEPGLYGTELAGGIRIENQYLVTKTGIENLTPFPIELA